MWVRIALLSCIALRVAPAAGPLIDYVTYLGGSYADTAAGIAVDSTGAAYVAGTTSSPDFPLTSTSLGTPTTNSYCAFVTKLNPSGTAIDFSVCLASSRANAFALDATGNMYLAVETFSSPFFASAGRGMIYIVSRFPPRSVPLIFNNPSRFEINSNFCSASLSESPSFLGEVAVLC